MEESNSRKGISPLIASVLLIAFTLSVAMIANPFFSNTLKDIQSGTSERADTVTRAANLGLEIMSVEFNRSSNELEVVVQNTGEAIDNETNVSIGVIGGSVAKTQQYDVDLGTNEITTLNLPVDRTYPLDTVQAALTNYPVTTEKGIKCTPTKGLVGYWSFNEEQTKNGWAVDLSGYGNNGSLKNGVSTGVSGQIGEAYSFDGSDDYVNTFDPDIGTNESFTIQAKPYVIDQSQKNVIFSTKTDNSGFEMKGVDKLSLVVTKLDGTVGSTRDPNSYSPEKWNTFTGKYNGSKSKLYRNGNLVEEGNFASVTGSQSLFIGKSSKWSEYFEGRIDELRIYNRSLSQSEIQRLNSVKSESWAVDACKLTG